MSLGGGSAGEKVGIKEQKLKNVKIEKNIESLEKEKEDSLSLEAKKS